MIDIVEIIEKYDKITIFRHQSPDMDALGSQFGLKAFIMSKFPDKKVFVLGDDRHNFDKVFDKSDVVSDNDIIESLAIVLDCGNSERIDDERFNKAQCILKIDHHPDVDDYSDIKYVDTSAGACCQILCELIAPYESSVNKDCARNLFLGLVADTVDFTTPTTSERTFKAAAMCLSKGIDVSDIRDIRKTISLHTFKLFNYIRNNCVLDGSIGKVILSCQDYESLGYTFEEVRKCVFCLADVAEFKVWCLFVENPENGLYIGSLRSKKEYIINEIAAKYNGGGHPNACGVGDLALADISKLVEELKKIL